MLPDPIPLDKRQDLLGDFVSRRVLNGYEIVSLSERSAELYKPRIGSLWLARAESLFVDVDEVGRIWVRKSTLDPERSNGRPTPSISKKVAAVLRRLPLRIPPH